MEAAVGVGTMPMVVKNISAKEVRKRGRIANPTVLFTETAAA
jgi:hypothetical protein